MEARVCRVCVWCRVAPAGAPLAAGAPPAPTPTRRTSSAASRGCGRASPCPFAAPPSRGRASTWPASPAPAPWTRPPAEVPEITRDYPRLPERSGHVRLQRLQLLLVLPRRLLAHLRPTNVGAGAVARLLLRRRELLPRARGGGALFLERAPCLLVGRALHVELQREPLRPPLLGAAPLPLGGERRLGRVELQRGEGRGGGGEAAVRGGGKLGWRRRAIGSRTACDVRCEPVSESVRSDVSQRMCL